MLSEEEKKAIERLEEQLNFWKKQNIKNSDCEIILNLITKLQKENEKLRDKEQDLLRKLRNRVKEVKKLNKYSLYKKEFSRLNKTIKEKDKQIDLMSEYIYNTQMECNIYYKDKEEVKNKFAKM